MNRKQRTEIDPSLCIGCGRCVEVCPSDTLEMQLGKARVVGEFSMGCGHCAAICPAGAITVGWGDPAALAFETIQVPDDQWSPEQGVSSGQLVSLMLSRRSCRSYHDKPVSAAVLDDLVKVGRTAPSGTNSQGWSFTVIPQRAGVMTLGAEVANYFKRLNRLVELGPVRLANRLVPSNPLAAYSRDYHEAVKEALEAWERGERDRLFHGATAAIIIGSQPGAATPAEDALLATQNILLAAHTVGLGTCLIGFAVEVMKRSPKVKEIVGIPKKEKIYSVIAIGHPKHKYRRATSRSAEGVRYSFQTT
jgi:nitroreductase/NAD-dependent dihydropyrimidine dehydrogenase PreA subunit